MQVFKIVGKRKDARKPSTFFRAEYDKKTALRRTREKFPEIKISEIQLVDIDAHIKMHQELKFNEQKNAEERLRNLMGRREKLFQYEEWKRKTLANPSLVACRVHMENPRSHYDCLTKSPHEAEEEAKFFHPDSSITEVILLNLEERIEEHKEIIKSLEKKIERNIQNVSRKGVKIRQLLALKRMIENNEPFSEENSLLIESL